MAFDRDRIEQVTPEAVQSVAVTVVRVFETISVTPCLLHAISHHAHDIGRKRVEQFSCLYGVGRE